jgi:hypothetical protein
MPLLRFLDPDGEERDIVDINHLFELIQTGLVSYDSLVLDDNAGQWVPARDHEFFVRIRNIARQNPSPVPSANQRKWYKLYKLGITQKAVNRGGALFRTIAPGHRFLVVSICIYIVSVIVCLAALMSGRGATGRPLVILLATPILLPIALRALIPSMLFVWVQIGSPFVSISRMRQAIARNGGFIVGVVFMTSVIFAAVVALGD